MNKLTRGISAMAKAKPDAIWFKNRLADRQLSQRALARIMKLDVSSINRCLTGERAVSLAEAAAFARNLHVDLHQICRCFNIETAGIEMPKNNNGDTNKD